MKPLRVGILGYENVNALDVVGPAEAFASALANDRDGKSDRLYEVVLVGLTRA